MTEKMFIPEGKKLLDPKIDSTFKTIFTKDGESSQIALRSLIGAIIGHEPESVELANNELPVEVVYAKNIRLDLQCRMPDGSRIDIEMQTCLNKDDLKTRALYYSCRMMSSIDMHGKLYKTLPKVYQVMFTNFPLFDEEGDYVQTFTMRNDETELTDGLQVIFIQMPLLTIDESEVENLPELEKWVIFLKEVSNEKKRELINRLMASSAGIREAGEILMTISDDFREWAIQESRYKGEVDYESGLLAAKCEGKEEGIQIGIENTARGMKAKNIPVETIIEITGLTAEQVAAL